MAFVFKRRRRLNGRLIESSRWYVRLWDPWNRRYITKSTGYTDKIAAMKAAKELQVYLERERKLPGHGTKRPDHKWFVMEYVAQCESQQIYSPQWCELIKRRLLMYAHPPYDPDAFRKRLEMKNWHPKTYNDTVGMMRGFFTWMYANGYIQNNPAKRVLMKKIPDDLNKPVRRTISYEEFQRLLSVVDDDEDKASYLLAVYCGLRAREISVLRPEFFDFEECILRLPGTISYKNVPYRWIRITKNGRPATMAFPPELGILLKRLIHKYDPVKKTWLRRPSVHKFKQYLEKAGIPYITQEGRFDIHALRACCVTWALDRGATLEEAAMLARHQRTNLVRIYDRPGMDRAKRMLSFLPRMEPGLILGDQRSSSETDRQPTHAVR